MKKNKYNLARKFYILIILASALTIKSAEDNSCAICYEGMLDNISTPYECTHIYHRSCSDKWKGSCPLCRAPIKYINYNFIKQNIVNDNRANLEQNIFNYLERDSS